MRSAPFLPTVLVAFALIVGCTVDDPASVSTSEVAAPASQPAASVLVPVVPDPVVVSTVVLQAGLPAPVPVPGEYLDFEITYLPEGDRSLDLQLALGADLNRRNDLIVCAGSPTFGLAPCTATGAGGSITPVLIPFGTDENELIDVYLLLESDEWRPLRRLLQVRRADMRPGYQLRSEYETLDDILTTQPAADGNYLEPTL